MDSSYTKSGHILNALMLMDFRSSPCTSSGVKALGSNNVLKNSVSFVTTAVLQSDSSLNYHEKMGVQSIVIVMKKKFFLTF